MEVEVRAVVEQGGSLRLSGLPFEPGREVNVRVTSELAPALRLGGEDWVRAMEDLASTIHARHPKTPVLTDDEMSRETIYEDRGL